MPVLHPFFQFDALLAHSYDLTETTRKSQCRMGLNGRLTANDIQQHTFTNASMHLNHKTVRNFLLYKSEWLIFLSPL
jgi:hypothetical protein